MRLASSLKQKAAPGPVAPEPARKSRKDTSPIVIVIDDSDDEVAADAGMGCTNAIAGPSRSERSTHVTAHPSAVSTFTRRTSSSTGVARVASEGPVSILLDTEEELHAVQIRSTPDTLRDCTPPPPTGSSVSLNTLSSKPLNKPVQQSCGDPTSARDNFLTEVDNFEGRSTPLISNLATSEPRAASSTSSILQPGVDFDVDALDDEGNVWDNGDDEQQGDTETPGPDAEEEDEDEDDLCEELEQPKKVGRCLGEIVLDEAESQSQCPMCGMVTDDWTHEVARPTF